MPFYASPGIYVEEVPGGARPIGAVGTSTAGFVGVAPDEGARRNEAVAINSWSEFMRVNNVRSRFSCVRQPNAKHDKKPIRKIKLYLKTINKIVIG